MRRRCVNRAAAESSSSTSLLCVRIQRLRVCVCVRECVSSRKSPRHPSHGDDEDNGSGNNNDDDDDGNNDDDGDDRRAGASGRLRLRRGQCDDSLKMADDDPWLLKEDGFLNVGAECRQIVYHPNLNVLLITTAQGQVHVFDVSCGVVLLRCNLLSGES